MLARCICSTPCTQTRMHPHLLRWQVYYFWMYARSESFRTEMDGTDGKVARATLGILIEFIQFEEKFHKVCLLSCNCSRLTCLTACICCVQRTLKPGELPNFPTHGPDAYPTASWGSFSIGMLDSRCNALCHLQSVQQAKDLVPIQQSIYSYSLVAHLRDALSTEIPVAERA